MIVRAHGSELEIDVFGDTDPKKMPGHMFHGALHIDYATAVKADVSRQHPATCPRYWYVSIRFKCVDCKEDFIFSVDEQRYWYEELKFFPGITPIRCAPCRKMERNRRLDEQRPKSKRG